MAPSSSPFPWPEDYSPRSQIQALKTQKNSTIYAAKPPTSIERKQTLPYDLFHHLILNLSSLAFGQVCGSYPNIQHVAMAWFDETAGLQGHRHCIGVTPAHSAQLKLNCRPSVIMSTQLSGKT